MYYYGPVNFYKGSDLLLGGNDTLTVLVLITMAEE